MRVPAAKAVAPSPPTPPHVPEVAPAPEAAVAVPAEMMAAPTKKPFPLAVIVIVVVVILLGGGAAAWFLSRLKAISQTPPTAQVPAPVTAPSPPIATESPSTPPPIEEAPAPAPAAVPPGVSTAPRKRAAKPLPTPAPAPVAPAANPRAEQIFNLETLAREAYTKGNYAEPPTANAITYAKQVLALDAGNDYARTILENSVNGGKYQMQQAIARKDFPNARRIADALAKLLPERRDVVELTEDIASAERADQAAQRPKAPTPTVSFRADHLHTDKAPADNGPYCQGSLSILEGRLKFVGETATDGKTHTFDFACSDIREIKKNSRLASRQNGFHVRTPATNINFVPEDSSAAHISSLASACSK